ncbi:MAG: alpha-glucuronidase family glycosyl hydrolase, partial [Arenibacter algicola]
MKRQLKFWLVFIGIGSILSCEKEQQKTLDLSQANIVISAQIKSPIQETAASILVEEIKNRTDLQLGLNNNWYSKTTIALALANEKELFGTKVPARDGENTPESKKEGYRIFHQKDGDKNTLWVIAADKRGILYGI